MTIDITTDRFNDFVQGYCEALLWANTVELDESGEETDRTVYPEDWQTPYELWALDAFDPESRKKILSDCRDFWESNAADLAGINPDQAGHDFLLTRSGHGAGFWDRGLGELGDRLSEAAEIYGDVCAEFVDGSPVRVV